jgi:hypothetical protein
MKQKIYRIEREKGHTSAVTGTGTENATGTDKA